ncbi:hypothetical protein GCM10028807_59230 [Spirosoma daeguense]
MKKVTLFMFLCLSGSLAFAQDEEPVRSLGATYYAKSLEQANVSLVASNIVSSSQQVEYKAGKSVVLTPGFEARPGAVFTAHTGAVKSTFKEGDNALLAIIGYPNPFIERTNISYKLADNAYTNLYVTTTEGKVVGRLVDNKFQSAGQYDVEWRAADLPSGSYLCVLEAGGKRVASRLIRK